MRFLIKVLYASFLVVCVSCSDAKPKIKVNNLETLFTSIPNALSNIDFKNTVNQTNNFNCLNYTYALIGGGVGVGDFNNDGLEDVYFVSNQNSNKLFLNKGDFTFKDITELSKTSDALGWSTGVSLVDINNDGWLDIYVCKSASISNPELRKNKLFVNLKDGSFKEEGETYGLDHDGFSIQSYFFDYDRDGDLDMYLVNHRIDFENTLKIEETKNQKIYPETSDHLFRNDGGYFTDITLKAGVANKAWGLSASIGDFNNDGWPDIYVANDYIAPDILYINKRNGTFSNQIDSRFQHISYNSMGCDFADINNDFLPDLMVLEMSAEDHIRSKENMPSMNTKGFQKIVNSNYHYPYMSNVLQLNNGNGSFSDIGQLAGVSKTDWSWAPLIADFDCDGYKDIFISNGVERNFGNQDYARQIKQNLENGVEMTKMEVIKMIPSDKLANYSYKNNGDLTFTKTIEAWGFDSKLNTNGVAYGDFDNDGDLDLVMNNLSDQASIYRNNATGNFLNVRLKGSSSNKDAIGAKVKVFTKNKSQYQELYTTRGYLSSVTKVLNFGLGSENIIDKVEVVWDNGLVSLKQDVLPNQTIVFDIINAQTKSPSKFKTNRHLTPINPNRIGLNFLHKENIFNDFESQVLLPQKLSNQGPGISIGDLNNDNLDDFYIGSAMGQPGEMYVQNDSGFFDRINQELFYQDSKYEDQNALLFDFDNDRDLDLYVSSGGYELKENDLKLQDRLYVNNGKGSFVKTNKLPKMLSNTKSVVAFDYDKDGYKDLFIGGHVKPGKYPLSSKSYILKNKNGTFVDVTKEVAPQFSTIGIINDMVVSDFDNDDDLDLIIVGEWLPITILENNKGVFSTLKPSEFEFTNGWWNTISKYDYDQDGDDDYFVGNLGDNNKFKPSKNKPLHIFAGNFDDNDSFDFVLSKEYKGNLVPVRGKECSTQQNAFISEKMPTFKKFANSTLFDIYCEEKLKTAIHKEAHLFSSIYIENKGMGTFEITNLPNEAQLGPTMGFEFGDINNDGQVNVLGIGAIHEAEVETIRYDSNIGYILQKDEEDKFKPYKDLNFYNNRNAKGIKQMVVKGKTYYVINNNNSALTIFKKN